MSSNAEASGGGIGFFGLLTIVFITLKLAGITEVATWSWWWVLAPIWLPTLILVVIFFAILLWVWL